MFRNLLRACTISGLVRASQKKNYRYNPKYFAFLVGISTPVVVCEEPKKDDSSDLNAGQWKEGLTVYQKKDLEAHKDRSSVWVRYKEGVYDITGFVAKHPGGIPRIMLAAGGPIDAYWNMYKQHMKPTTHSLLEEYRIGNYLMSEEEKKAGEKKPDDPYANDPERNPTLRVLSQRPFNAETPPVLLADNFITPTELFFKRHHFPVPIFPDPNAFTVNISVDSSSEVLKSPLSLSVSELKSKFPKHEVVCVIQCAGNRRRGFNKYQTTRGLDWEGGAIGNTIWGGALLVDVLEDCGISHRKLMREGYKHVVFIGADKDPSTGEKYVVSVPIEKVLNAASDCLLAYEMGREELISDHGGPLRIIVPGVVGARSVKWIERIVFSKEETNAFYQKQDYRVLPTTANLSDGKVDWKQAPPIYDTPVQSFICYPAQGGEICGDDDVFKVKGYAYSGGGRAIVRVEISADGGKTWQVADIISNEAEEAAKKSGEEKDFTNDGKNPFGYDYFKKHNLEKSYGWTLFEKEIEIPDELKHNGGELKLMARAVDSAYNLQVNSSEALWNGRGCCLTEQPINFVKISKQTIDDEETKSTNK